jgi:hypothetical protein
MASIGIDRLKGDAATSDVATEVRVARKALEDARSALDLAVAALPDVDGEEAMATPSLLMVLVGAVRAKQHLNRLETVLASRLAEGR